MNNATVNGGGAVVQGSGSINQYVNPPAKKRVSLDTKMVLGILIVDVVMFFYGQWSYTGHNTTADTWRAAIFLVLLSVTVGMIRRWLRRRT